MYKKSIVRSLRRGMWGRKVASLLLALAVIVTSFPPSAPEVYAAERLQPSRFVTMEQLKTFNTDATDGTEN